MAAVQGLVMGVNTMLITFMESRRQRQVEKLKEAFGRVKKDSVGTSRIKSTAHCAEPTYETVAGTKR
ncbi:Protein of unknown function [Gryllus bimaculatus]|nr:Protein of unknown function [Gryllus bimaculatus]